MTEFTGFPKMPRLSREIVISEKLDGTNAQVCITEEGEFLVGSRTRWITPEDDNYGFAKWCEQNKEDLLQLGVGKHFGEWWGQGIQRKYDMDKKVFSLFNVSRWSDEAVRPSCCSIVPTLYRGPFDTTAVEGIVEDLRTEGSAAAPGFMRPEGIIVFHTAGYLAFKKTLEKDEKNKYQL